MCRLFLLVVLLLCPVASYAEEGAKSDWRVEIVPSRHSHGKGKIIYAKKPRDVFYVVLHNQSSKDLSLWRDWSPWGYHMISFAVELQDASEVKLHRKPMKWDKAYPDAVLVKSGACYVYEIHLAGKTWAGLKDIPNDQVVSMTAKFKISETPESKQKKVWTGEITSGKVTLAVRK